MGPGLVATDLTFGYQSDRLLLNGWSAEFPPDDDSNSRTVRAGKSTLLYLLGLMLRPSQGSVAIDGLPLSDRPADRDRARYRAAHFGFVFQDAALDPHPARFWTISSRPPLYRGQPAAKPRSERVNSSFEFDVDVEEDQRPGRSPAARPQRIALCRAPLNRPRVVLSTSRPAISTRAPQPWSWRRCSPPWPAEQSQSSSPHVPEVADLCDRVIEL